MRASNVQSIRRLALTTRRPAAARQPSLRCRASSDAKEPIYRGRYGTWSLDERDRLEVMAYRVSLTVAAVGMCFCTTTKISFNDLMILIYFLSNSIFYTKGLQIKTQNVIFRSF